MKRSENLLIAGLNEQWFTDVSKSEWERAFEAFKSFTYNSITTRIEDFRTVTFMGVLILTREHYWKECRELTDWALSDLESIQSWPQLIIINYYRAISLVHEGQGSMALREYLCAATANIQARNRHGSAFALGVHLLSEIVEGEDEITGIPNEMLKFAHDLFVVRYPKKPVPVALRLQSAELRFDWERVHKALIRHIK